MCLNEVKRPLFPSGLQFECVDKQGDDLIDTFQPGLQTGHGLIFLVLSTAKMEETDQVHRRVSKRAPS